MSREIKFRAWDNEHNRYYKPIHAAYKGKLEELMVSMKGDLLLHTIQGVSHESTFPGRFVLEQFTGLKDKNGKEIFEGDILEEDKGHYFEVVFDQINACFMLQWRTKAIQYPGWNRGKMMTVIGTIHENPELLR